MSELVQPVDRTVPTVSQTEQVMSSRKSVFPVLLPLAVVAIILGVGTGYLLSARLMPATGNNQKSAQTDSQLSGGKSGKNAIQVGVVFGAKDATSYPDTAEGVLVAGGRDGEGSHHLLREGGESQNVYLTSSSINLDDFINMKVTVRGQTNRAQKAGWLLDVGQLKVEQLNAPKPAWAQAKEMEKEGN